MEQAAEVKSALLMVMVEYELVMQLEVKMLMVKRAKIKMEVVGVVGKDGPELPELMRPGQITISSVLRTGSMGHLSKSPTTISKISSNFGKIGLKKMLGGVVLPPRTLFSPGVSFSQWTSQWLPRS